MQAGLVDVFVRNGRTGHLGKVQVQVFLAVAGGEAAEISAVPRQRAVAEMRAYGVGHLCQGHLIAEHRVQNERLLFLDFIWGKIARLEAEILLVFATPVVRLLDCPELLNEDENSVLLEVLGHELHLARSVGRVHLKGRIFQNDIESVSEICQSRFGTQDVLGQLMGRGQ